MDVIQVLDVTFVLHDTSFIITLELVLSFGNDHISCVNFKIIIVAGRRTDLWWVLSCDFLV